MAVSLRASGVMPPRGGDDALMASRRQSGAVDAAAGDAVAVDQAAGVAYVAGRYDAIVPRGLPCAGVAAKHGLAGPDVLHDREGVCTTWLEEKLAPFFRGEAPALTLKVFLKASEAFQLPEDPDAPVVMIGPGTGVAPFRGFIQRLFVERTPASAASPRPPITYHGASQVRTQGTPLHRTLAHSSPATHQTWR